MTIHVPFSEPRSFKVTPPGSPEKDVYEGFYDDYGRLYLQKVGVEDTYGLIQSFANDCDINMLYERYTKGDVDALNQRQGYFVDLTGMPSDLLTAQNVLLASRELYDGLPKAERARYVDFSDFLANYQGQMQQASQAVSEAPEASSITADMPV